MSSKRTSASGDPLGVVEVIDERRVQVSGVLDVRTESKRDTL